MENLVVLKDYIIKILDFAYAIELGEKNPSIGGIALTMSGAIQDCGEKALGVLESMTGTSHIS